MAPRPPVAAPNAVKTIRRLFFGEVVAAVTFATIGFLALFYFFDLVDELRAIGRANAPGYQLPHALTYVTLLVPAHFYELLPITVLMGTIFVMARLAQGSEFTILRTSGLGPWRALRVLLGLGLSFTALTFLAGDYLAPWADRKAQLLKVEMQQRLPAGQGGAWLKERREGASIAVNVASMEPSGRMIGVRIFEFGADGYLRTQIRAAAATIQGDNAWRLAQVERLSHTPAATPGASPFMDNASAAELIWPTEITAEMVSAAILRPERMSTIDLFQYSRHLRANGQSAQRYEILFWRKLFYPLSCLVMVVLALPFAYLHFRSGSIAGYVFMGVMAGISFFLLNNVFGYIGTLNEWVPWVTAAAPGFIYSLISLGAMAWLVLRR